MTSKSAESFAPELDELGRSRRRAEKRARRWHRRRARLERLHPPCKSRLGEAGTVRGADIEPGSVEAGWTTPPPVRLDEKTTVRLFKDGQGLTAALLAIRGGGNRSASKYTFSTAMTPVALSPRHSRRRRAAASASL